MKGQYESRLQTSVESFQPGAEQPTVPPINAPIVQAKTLETDSRFYKRQTYYFTYEEIEALNELAHRKRMSKSEFLRDLLDKALEAESPGIFDEVKPFADQEREKNSK